MADETPKLSDVTLPGSILLQPPPIPSALANGATPPRARGRAIDQIRSAYYRTRHRMEIAAWADEDGKPLEVFFTSITPADVSALNARMDAQSGATNEDRHIALMIMKCRDDADRPLFQAGDAPALKSEAAWGIVIDVVNALYALGNTPTIEAAKELLTQDQALAFRVKLAHESGRSVEEIDSYPLRDLTLLAAYQLLMHEREAARAAEQP